MKIGEIMTREVRSLSPDMPVTEAVKKLLDEKISGLPVVTSGNKIAGIFTEKDVLKFILPSYVSQVGRFVYENWPKTIQSKVSKLAGLKVKDLMSKDVVKVTEETPVSEAAHMMLTQNVRRLPVVDDKDMVKGIVSRSDVLSKLVHE